MRVTTISSTMTCPRCTAPIRGDYKYCPECAFRLRRRGPERPEPPHGGPGTLLLALAGLLLLGAGIFVGTTVLKDAPPSQPSPQTPPPSSQTTLDIQAQLVPIKKGIAYYAVGEVLVAPEVDVAFAHLFHRMADEQRGHLLRELDEHPRVHTRWARMLSLFYDATIDLLEMKEKAVPIYTDPFLCMRYEVSRGQWKEFLRAAEQEPGMFSDRGWVNMLRRAATGPDADDRSREAAVWSARLYRKAWWEGVLAHYKALDNERRKREWKHLDAERKAKAKDEGKDENGAESGELDWETIPRSPPPQRPAWLGPQDAPTQADLAKLTDAQAFYLLVPPSWIRVQEDGSLSWGDDDANDDLPVTEISWYDAHMFAIWARKRTGNPKLRLPNWREWQRVFHSGKPRLEQRDGFGLGPFEGNKWPWGNEDDPRGCNNRNYAWKNEVPRLRSVRKPYSIHRGQTENGILNMAGNAMEWTRNVTSEEFGLRGDEYYVSAPDKKEAELYLAYACGGSYLVGIDDCTVDAHESLMKTSRRIDVGFRLVADPLL